LVYLVKKLNQQLSQPKRFNTIHGELRFTYKIYASNGIAQNGPYTWRYQLFIKQSIIII